MSNYSPDMINADIFSDNNKQRRYYDNTTTRTFNRDKLEC